MHRVILPTIQQNTAKKIWTVSQKIKHSHAGNQSQTWPQMNDFSSVTLDKRNEGAISVESDQNLDDCWLVNPLAFKLDKIKDKEGSDMYELIELLNQDNYNLSVFKEVIKSSNYCPFFCQNEIELSKEGYSQNSCVDE